jgi:hypothetical protein
MEERISQTSPLRIILAWILVTIPLGWGVYQSVVKSLPLFQIGRAGNTSNGPPL